MSYHHFSMNERMRIEILHNLGYSTRQIGCKLGRYHSKTAKSMEIAINQMIKTLPNGSMKTATTDMVNEFTCYEALK